jgi:hypothetical protein
MPLLAALVSGCTAEQAFNAGQGWQRNQCSHLPDKAEFDRCMSNTSVTYDAYKRQTEAGQK